MVTTTTTTTQHDSDTDTSSLLALSAFLQHKLQVLVTTSEFWSAGRNVEPLNYPCSLVTIEPFSPGGLRRLALNVHSPLIREIAKYFKKRVGRNENNAAVVVSDIGEVFVRSGTWPIQFIDDNANVHWRMTRGLIATPHELYCWPVPHHQVVVDNDPSSSIHHVPIAVWPKRICNVRYKRSRGNPSGAAPVREVVYVSEVWRNRDEMLKREFQRMLTERQHDEEKCTIVNRLLFGKKKVGAMTMTRLFPTWGSGGHPPTPSPKKDDYSSGSPDVILKSTSALATFAPSLPVIVAADYLARTHRVPSIYGLGEAARLLVRNDRMFGLSLFFNVPMIDRTRTLSSTLRTAPICPPPPTKSKVETFLRRNNYIDHSDDDPNADDASAAQRSLRHIMLQRAKEIWQSNNEGDIYVAWSGGIDSTAVLAALLQTAANDDDDGVAAGGGRSSTLKKKKCRLKVILDDESIQENPKFYDRFVKDKLPTVQRAGRTLSTMSVELQKTSKGSSIVVTGELGDQLFGSDRMAAAFETVHGHEHDDNLLPSDIAGKAPPPLPDTLKEIFVEKGLAAPWEETILLALECIGLLGEGGYQAWKDWIRPQLHVSPIPIVSTYDFLWWLNFSMKWQNVSLRCCHDGGTPLVKTKAAQSRGPVTIDDLTGSIRHFYGHRDFECWSCVDKFHTQKFPDLTSWKTYKQPLKAFIHEFDGDEAFFKDKLKVASLCFGAPAGIDSSAVRFHGIIVDTQESASGSIVISDPFLLEMGYSLQEPLASAFTHLIDENVLDKLNAYPNLSTNEVDVSPWTNPVFDISPFESAPYFAETDERQRRVFNPVTKNTLEGKCSALVVPDLVRGRTFLDLGACLGASCYWALCAGAKNVTAVEVQKEFCARAESMLKHAEGARLWPKIDEPGDRFQVVCCGIRDFLKSCPDNSFDVVLAAGILQCFPDPVEILTEMARVSAESVLIEAIQSDCYQQGSLLDPIGTSNVAEQKRTPVTRMLSAVRPLASRVEGGGLFQASGDALVNMAGQDASFIGLSVLPSRLAVELLMSRLGFDMTRVNLADHPTKPEDLWTYTLPRQKRATPNRYFLRCTKTRSDVKSTTLENIVLNDDKSHMHEWTNCILSTQVSTHKSTGANCGRPRARSESDPTHQWEFDRKVAERFDTEARCHIPDYAAIVEDSIRLLEKEADRYSGYWKESAKIVDVGCATGYTVDHLYRRGFKQVHGVDLSAAMLEQAKKNLGEHGHAGIERVLHLSESPHKLPRSLGGQLDGVILNWTLHFVVSEDERKIFLQNIADSMKKGSLLILTEKTRQNEETKSAYYDFKRSMGVTEEEIKTKEARLRGVLETFDLKWYLEILDATGFENASIFRAKHGFVTFVARKRSECPLVHVETEESFRVWEDVTTSGDSVHYEAKESEAPFVTRAWSKAGWTGGASTGTVYGFVFEGSISLRASLGTSSTSKSLFTLHKGMYFACPGEIELSEGGSGVLQLVKNHRALFAMGYLENGQGRLPYIDSCTDTLLLSPVVKGAPCLNHLHFPPSVVQTQHTHPSGRSGIVVSGQGTCVCGKTRTVLKPGTVFVIPERVVHAFETSSLDSLDVVAFHPDSDFGPSPTDHPMINRTIVNGRSASSIPSIQTTVFKATIQ